MLLSQSCCPNGLSHCVALVPRQRCRCHIGSRHWSDWSEEACILDFAAHPCRRPTCALLP
eukprot:3685045-Amphidinium_carterae.1